MREKALVRLRGRYDDVTALMERGLSSPQHYYQLLSNVAHYAQYVDETKVARKAIKKLSHNKQATKLDKELIEDADKLLERMKVDRDKLMKAARRRGIKVEFPDTGGVARRLTDEEGFAIHLSGVNNFLDDKDQYVGDLPKYMGELRVCAWRLAEMMQRPPQWLEDLKTAYNADQDAFAIKLERLKVLKDYLRLDDYKEIEKIRSYIYGTATNNEALYFVLINDDLIDKSNTRQYQPSDVHAAKEKADAYIVHLQRLHNYLEDELENPSIWEKAWTWILEHLLPTFASSLILLVIYLVLHHLFNVPISLKEVLGMGK
jgi:hypothetical protein